MILYTDSGESDQTDLQTELSLHGTSMRGAQAQF